MANETILIVDDSREIATITADYILIPAGYRVIFAYDGQEGLDRIQQEQPDLVLLDLQMPRMTGLEVLDELQKRENDIPLILMTSHGSEQLAVTVFRKGVKDYIVKPLESDALLAIVEKALTEARLRREKQRLTENLLKANRELERRVKELNTLYGIGRSVASVLELDRLLSRIVEAAVYITGAEEGSLLLLDDETNELFMRSAQGLEEKFAREFRLRVEDSFAGEVIRTGEPIAISGGTGHHKVKTSYLVNSILYVPLKIDDRVAGVLTVDNRVSTQDFSKNDQFLLSLLSDWAAVAINNARLFGQVEHERHTLQAILSGTEDMIVVTDLQNKVQLINESARRAFRVTIASPLGIPLQEALPNDYLLSLYRTPAGGDSTTRGEVPLEDDQTLLATVSPVPGVGHVAVLKDITHLKKLDQMKSDFVSTVSHDLRSPLTSICGFADLLPIVGPMNEQQLMLLAKVQDSVQDIASLISDLLDIGRIEAGIDLEKEPCEMTEVVTMVVERLSSQAQAKHQMLCTEFVVEPVPVLANRLRLAQVITNLVSNAIKYTPDKGVIMARVDVDGSYAKVSVRDNGIGIPISEQSLIFDNFYRVQSEATQGISGTGLGLSIVRSIVEKHNGRVWVDSQEGAGSTFTFLLPRMMEEQTTSSYSESDHPTERRQVFAR